MAVSRGGMTIEEVLIEGGFLTRSVLGQLQAESRQSGQRLIRILVTGGHLIPSSLACVLSFSFNVAIADLKGLVIQPEALKLVPADIAKRCNILPCAVDGDLLRVVMEDPTDQDTLDILRAQTRKRIKPTVAIQSWEELQQKIEEVYQGSV